MLVMPPKKDGDKHTVVRIWLGQDEHTDECSVEMVVFTQVLFDL